MNRRAALAQVFIPLVGRINDGSIETGQGCRWIDQNQLCQDDRLDGLGLPKALTIATPNQGALKPNTPECLAFGSSVVMIFHVQDKGEEHWRIGAAVLVGNRVLTSAGLFDGVVKTFVGPTRLSMVQAKGRTVSSSEPQLATIDVELPAGKDGAKISPEEPYVGQEVVVTGCPYLISVAMRTHICCISGDEVITPFGGSGIAGGGVFDLQGRIIAVNFAGSAGEGSSLLTSIRLKKP